MKYFSIISTVFILIVSICLIFSKHECLNNIAKFLFLLSFINGLITWHYLSLVNDAEIKIISLVSKNKELETENEGLYDDFDKAQKEIILIKASYQDLEFNYDDLSLKYKNLSEEKTEKKESLLRDILAQLEKI